MFKSARLKLTLWYVLISISISILFSISVYFIQSHEYEDSFRHFQLRIERGRGEVTPEIFIRPRINYDEIIAAQNRVKQNLIYINLAILGISSVAGYFLAGRALSPIKKMVDEQNRFIADASHELRTPLTSLQTAIEVNLRDKNLTANLAKKVLKGNLEDIHTLKTLSNNLLALAQFQESHKGISFERLPISEIINPAIKKVQNLAKEKSISIALKTEDSFILGDKDRLVELFVILFDNAIKYSTDKGEIKISAEFENSFTNISIQDFGVGIEKKDLTHIFNRFYRGDQSRSKEKTGGYGLGLSIAKKIVDTHNGSIQVTSAPKKGSTFTVKLPKAQ